MNRFRYVLDKIRCSSFRADPFQHVYIEDVFDDRDFKEIVNTPEIQLPVVADDQELFAELERNCFEPIDFPGTTRDIETYLRWHQERKSSGINYETTDGFGVTLRLKQTQEGTVLRELDEFFNSDLFWKTLAEKFDIDLSQVRRDTGLQKYLDGYEISPHPDIKLKALTFMLNLNPSPDSEQLDYHTRYMTFKKERRFVGEYWATNEGCDRCWVPWTWCETVAQQRKNNSIVIFVPSNDTLHAVKASYDHLKTQRTQYYGNLWFLESKTSRNPNWRFYEQVACSSNETR